MKDIIDTQTKLVNEQSETAKLISNHVGMTWVFISVALLLGSYALYHISPLFIEIVKQ